MARPWGGGAPVALENDSQVPHDAPALTGAAVLAGSSDREAQPRHMIVCECTGVTDGTIRALARDGVTKVAEVTRRCGAGGCCQSCRPAISRILRVTAKEEAVSSASTEATVSAEPATA